MANRYGDSNVILGAALNEDATMVVLALHTGFAVFDCRADSFVEEYRRKLEGGIGLARILGRTNIVALCGGGPFPSFPRNQLRIWDDNDLKFAAELSFLTDVIMIDIRRGCLIVSTEHQVLLYKLQPLEAIAKWETSPNPTGLVTLSRDTSNIVLAFPALSSGAAVQCHQLAKSADVLVSAHQTNVTLMCVSGDGSLLATASGKGTLVRVFDISAGGKLVREFRRGATHATLTGIDFGPRNEVIAVVSDNGTVHLFKLGNDADEHHGGSGPGEVGYGHGGSSSCSGGGPQHEDGDQPPDPRDDVYGGEEHRGGNRRDGQQQQQQYQQQHEPSSTNLRSSFTHMGGAGIAALNTFMHSATGAARAERAFAWYSHPCLKDGGSICKFGLPSSSSSTGSSGVGGGAGLNSSLTRMGVSVPLVVVTRGGQCLRLVYDAVNGGECTLVGNGVGQLAV